MPEHMSEMDIQDEQEQTLKHRLNKRLAAVWEAVERGDTDNE